MGTLRADVVSHSQLTAANASVLFDGSGSSGGSTGLRTADGDHGYALGSENESITIECWINCTSVSQTFDAIFATNNYGVSGNALILYNNNDGLYMSGTGFVGGADYAEYGILEADTWYHIAFVKEKSQIRLYLDGQIKAYRETTSNFTEDQLCIGCSNYGGGFPTYSFAGYISNFRINKRALYKENFTPSKFKLKNIPGTTLLCCQDSSDDTTAAVGSISAGGSPTPGGFGPDFKEDNTDTGVVFEDNTKFDTLSYMVPSGGTTTERGRGRGILFGGEATPQVNTIQYVQIQSEGNAVDFGDLTQVSSAVGAVASSTRALSAGGWVAANTNVISYVTIATSSNATDFGDLAEAKHWIQGGGSQTRGIFAGGNANSPIGHTNTVEYVTIATAGNASNFGDIARKPSTSSGSAMNSTTRAVFGGGTDPSANALNTLEYVTIATTGDATDFGDMTDNKIRYGGCSSSTRGIIAAGGAPSVTNSITYITIATTGNTSDFGDVTTARQNVAAVTNSIRGLVAGGATPSDVNTIDYINIASTGNASDFGDEIITGDHTSGCSDSHGGIS